MLVIKNVQEEINVKYQKTIKLWLKVLMAMLLAFALAGPTSSQVVSTTDIDERIPVSFFTDNPCTPVFDNINLTGETHIKGQVITGVEYFNGRITTNLRGEDDLGVQYVVKEELKVKNKFPGEGPFSETYHFKVNAKGPADNYFIKAKYQISPTGEVKSFFESGCKN